MVEANPNIVLIMADQMTAFALSAYGNSVTKTPNLDALAAMGTVFENDYCNYPLCARHAVESRVCFGSYLRPGHTFRDRRAPRYDDAPLPGLLGDSDLGDARG